MNYLKDKDLYGILFENVVSQYIVFENNNLKEFASKLDVEDTTDVPDKIEGINLNNYTSSEELKSIVNKYFNIAIQTIPEDNFYKLKKSDVSVGDEIVSADGYSIDVKLKDLQAILLSILENAKNDEQIFNIVSKVNSSITFEDYQNYIANSLEELSAEEITEEENTTIFTVSVYKQGKKTVKLAIIVEDETEKIELSVENIDNNLILKMSENNETFFEITKTVDSQEQKNFESTLTIKLGDDNLAKVNINLSRTGALTSNNVTFDMNISIEITNGGSLNIGFKKTTDFSAVPKLGEFTEENHLIINTLSQEQITNLFNNLGNLLEEKLKDEMFLSMMNNDSLYQLASQASQATQDALQEGTSNMNEQTIEAFNLQFTAYEGIRRGTEIKMLQNAINSSNEINTEHIVTCSGVPTGEIDINKAYRVSTEKDSEGYINKVIIEEN